MKFVKGKKKTTEQFDCLMVTTGANAKPKLGPIKAALAGFEGEIIHSADYQKPEVFAGKRVLVVGQGESAADITTEISRHASATASWARRYIILAPRFPHLTVTDKDHDEETTMNDETADIAVNDFLETLTTSRFNVGQNVMAYGSTRQLMYRFLNSGFGPAGKNNLNATEMARQSLAACNGHGSQVFWMADQSQWVTKNSRMCREVALGNVEHIVSPKIESAQGRTLTFEGGKTVTVDVVVCCTGYGGSFDWITTDFGYDCAENCVRGFYKHAFPAGWGDKLAFAGYARPHQGGIPAAGEMVARCAARVFSGRLKLPADYAERAEVEAAAENSYYVLSPSLKPLVDYPSYMDSMARWLGCEPKVPWFRPALFVKYLLYPMWPCWYRLDGVGANREATMTQLDKVPLSKYKFLNPDIILVTPLYLVSKLLAILTYPFSPKSGLDSGYLWMWIRPKHYILHGNSMRFRDLFRP